MKTAFSRYFAKAGPVFLVFCLAASFQNARADSIDHTHGSNALIDSADELGFPGTPLADYAFSWGQYLSSSSYSPSDPGFFDLGLDGSFLMTGNSYYNFTGDLRVDVIQLHSAPGVGLNSAPGLRTTSSSDTGAALNTNVTTETPEPRSFWLLVGALGIMLASYKVWRSAAVDCSAFSAR